MTNQTTKNQMPFIIDDYQSLPNRILCEIFTNKSKWFADQEFGSNIHLIRGQKLTKQLEQDLKNEITTIIGTYLTNNEITSYKLNTELASNRINWQLDIIETNNQHHTLKGSI